MKVVRPAKTIFSSMGDNNNRFCCMEIRSKDRSELMSVCYPRALSSSPTLSIQYM